MLLASPQVLQLRKDAYVTVEADPVNSTISLMWRGFVPSPAYRSILNDALSNACLHKLRRWSLDLRLMNAILRQDERWTVEEWFPRLSSSGPLRMAVLMSDDLFNRMAVERMLAEVTPSLPFAITSFNGPREARSWLLGKV